MPESHPAACRRSAERCRQRAEAAKDAISKATWLKFAEEWSKLADEAEQSTGADGVHVGQGGSKSSDAEQFRVRWLTGLSALLRARVS
jgi:uncharacterized alpha-E superfamily protein